MTEPESPQAIPSLLSSGKAPLVTETRAKATGFATVYASGGTLDGHSSLNFGPETNVSNTTFTKVNNDGLLCVAPNVQTDMILDAITGIKSEAITPWPNDPRVLGSLVAIEQHGERNT